jgi:hypothetical protein
VAFSSNSSESEGNGSGAAFSSAGLESDGDIKFGSGFDAASEVILRRRRVGRSGVDFDWIEMPMEVEAPLL